MGRVQSIRNGEWYQDLYGWSRILDLSSNCRLERVRLEANDAGHVDDVIAYPSDRDKPVEYFQLKFHVGGEAGSYSTESFIASPKAVKRASPKGRASRAKSLLQKFWASWLALRDHPHGALLFLQSNWSWDTGDPLAPLISGTDDRLPERYYNAPSTTPVGSARERWRNHLSAEPEEFAAFIRAMRFRVGRGSIQQLSEQVAERMADRCLHADEHAINRAVGQVGEWIRNGVDTVTRDMYEEVLNDLRLRLPEADPAIRICLHTIERQNYPESADHILDWCDHFRPANDQQVYPRGHAVHDDAVWNDIFLPELQALKAHLNAGPIRLLRVRGQARLSAWTALGHVFDGRARYILEVDQNGSIWRTDASPAKTIAVTPAGIVELGLGTDVAVGVSITNRVGSAVRDTIDQLQLPIAALLTIEPATGVGRQAIRSAGQLTAFVESARQQTSQLVASRRARRVHFFYCGPFSGAAFLGHALGAAAPEVQLYEDLRPGYTPSFLLRA